MGKMILRLLHPKAISLLVPLLTLLISTPLQADDSDLSTTGAVANGATQGFYNDPNTGARNFSLLQGLGGALSAAGESSMATKRAKLEQQQMQLQNELLKQQMAHQEAFSQMQQQDWDKKCLLLQMQSIDNVIAEEMNTGKVQPLRNYVKDISQPTTVMGLTPSVIERISSWTWSHQGEPLPGQEISVAIKLPSKDLTRSVNLPFSVITNQPIPNALPMEDAFFLAYGQTSNGIQYRPDLNDVFKGRFFSEYVRLYNSALNDKNKALAEVFCIEINPYWGRLKTGKGLAGFQAISRFCASGPIDLLPFMLLRFDKAIFSIKTFLKAVGLEVLSGHSGSDNEDFFRSQCPHAQIMSQEAEKLTAL